MGNPVQKPILFPNRSMDFLTEKSRTQAEIEQEIVEQIT
jgi:hypothetical protein